MDPREQKCPAVDNTIRHPNDNKATLRGNCGLIQCRNTGEEKTLIAQFSDTISPCDAGLSDLGCTVQTALSEQCCYRRSQRGRGSSQSGTCCLLMD